MLQRANWKVKTQIEQKKPKFKLVNSNLVAKHGKFYNQF